MYPSENLLPISALQHLLFCPRQCALIHVERLWTENYFTAQGRILHERAHGKITESRKIKRTESSVQVVSYRYGIYGECDVIDFFKNGSVDIIEYKRGKPKENLVDKVQLCAQAVCIEEMLKITLTEGFLFYGETKHRLAVALDTALRDETEHCIDRLHTLIESRQTPKSVYTKQCDSCSFFEECNPKTFEKQKNVTQYIELLTEKGLLNETDS